MSDKNFLLILGVVSIILLTSFFIFREKREWTCANGQWVQLMPTDKPKPKEVCGDRELEYVGEVIALLAGNIDIELNEAESVSVFIYPKTKIIGLDGNSIDYGSIRPGFKVRASTVTDKENTVYAKEVRILEEPAVIMTAPVNGSVIGQQIKISGQARVYKDKLNFILKDYSDKILAEGSFEAGNYSQGKYGSFKLEVPVKRSGTQKGILEISYPEPGSDTPKKLNIPLSFQEFSKREVKIYFSLNRGNNTDCSKVEEVIRVVSNDPKIAALAIQELLKGPYLAEKRSGFVTNINEGVKLNKLTIVKGVARADFSKELDKNVAGSCRVIAIRSQIESTLKQFQTVKSVVISVDGRTEDILQP